MCHISLKRYISVLGHKVGLKLWICLFFSTCQRFTHLDFKATLWKSAWCWPSAGYQKNEDEWIQVFPPHRPARRQMDSSRVMVALGIRQAAVRVQSKKASVTAGAKRNFSKAPASRQALTECLLSSSWTAEGEQHSCLSNLGLLRDHPWLTPPLPSYILEIILCKQLFLHSSQWKCSVCLLFWQTLALS